MYTLKDRILITSLKNEDFDAWKHYLKQDKPDMALKHCRTKKQRAHVASKIAS